jgi:hypothetical protein
VKKTRQNKKLEPGSDSIRTDKALVETARTAARGSLGSPRGLRNASPGARSLNSRSDFAAGHFLDPALAAASVVDQHDRAGRHHAIERLLLDHRRIAWTGGRCELRMANAAGEQADTQREGRANQRSHGRQQVFHPDRILPHSWNRHAVFMETIPNLRKNSVLLPTSLQDYTAAC